MYLLYATFILTLICMVQFCEVVAMLLLKQTEDPPMRMCKLEYYNCLVTPLVVKCIEMFDTCLLYIDLAPVNDKYLTTYIYCI